MISLNLLKYLAYIWVTDGYDEFKSWIKDLGLIDKGFTVNEIRKQILDDSELMKYYIKDSAYLISKNSTYLYDCERLSKECVSWYEDNSHNL